MRKSLAVFLSGAALVVAASTALAGEQVLEFKLITKPIDVKVIEAANVEGQTVVSGKFFGVAVFKDGRIGVKEFVHSGDMFKGSGPFYRLQHLHLRGWLDHGALHRRGQRRAVKGRIYDLSGSGAYANARAWWLRRRAEPVKGVNLGT